MAEHKVPQDVEAEDKLLGPFSFRQFIYLLIAVGAGAIAFFLGKLAIPLAIIPLPVVALFGIIALPLKKDQPMETYLAAMIKFYFSPHIRLWDPDGNESLVEISNPVIDDAPKVKDVGGEEAARRLSFLADIEDTQGWATRGVGAPINKTNLTDDLAAEATNAQDILDNTDSLSESFDKLLIQSDQQLKQTALAHMQSDASVTPILSTPTTPVATTTSQDDEANAESLLAQAAAAAPQYNKPIIQQKVIQPLVPVAVSPTTPSPAVAVAVPTQAVQPATVPQIPVAKPIVTAQPQPQPQTVPAQPVSPEVKPVPAPAKPVNPPTAQTKPPQAPSVPKSDIINSDNAFSGEESIRHDGAATDDSEAVEISLH